MLQQIDCEISPETLSLFDHGSCCGCRGIGRRIRFDYDKKIFGLWLNESLKYMYILKCPAKMLFSPHP
jgi:hypothetical protein